MKACGKRCSVRYAHNVACVLRRAVTTGSHQLSNQVEFYFSDSNLPRDKFLNEKVAADPEGYVDIALLCTFSRMKALLKVRRRGCFTSHHTRLNSMLRPSLRTYHK